MASHRTLIGSKTMQLGGQHTTYLSRLRRNREPWRPKRPSPLSFHAVPFCNGLETDF
jgi:hypothetical protein